MHFPKWAAAFQFLKESMSEPAQGLIEGSASFSRLAAGFIIAFVLMWVSYLVFKTHTMPDLAGPTLFMTGGASATYGTNRVMAAMDTRSEANATNTDQAPTVVAVVKPTQVGN